MGRIIEGVWDCTYCGTTKVRGGLRECPQCGHPRDENVEFYMDNPQNYVLDETLAEKARQGPDWICQFCDCLNSATVSICEGCGSAREAETKDYFENLQEQQEKAKMELDEDPDDITNEAASESQSENFPVVKPDKQKHFNWGKAVKIGVVALLFVALIAGMVMLFTPREVSGTVVDMKWSRTVEIEEYKTVRESGWSIPSGGREVSRSEEIHHYNSVISHYETKTRTYTEQVLDHYEEYVSGYRDLGNGHFEEITSQRPVYRTETRTETYEEPVYVQVPVYETKYVYDIEKWVHQTNKRTEGNDKNPYWSDYECKTNERIGSKTEAYVVVVEDNDEKFKEYTLKFDEWNSLSVGQKVKLKTYITGSAELIIE